ncbi:hypothetical protein [Sulfobacillus sp. hq2]|uniref:hypothetical protein n=1 Tax=Sulfobacillus TaxID=28033 RepID=UPI000CD1CDE7|nr:hypothetical protein [Sulfobacillus sp. hq2]POB11133.1 hypothetical protein CO251_06215 [Sulfobacillus sp. hq2]
MVADQQKILTYIGRIAYNSPVIQTVVGYLMADPARVVFVRQWPEDQTLAMTMSIHRRIELAGPLWQGYVRGVPVPDPLTWIQAATPFRSAAIALRLSTDDVWLMEAVQPLIQSEEAAEYRAQLEERMQTVRQELDRALDLYNELRHIMEVDRERQPQLEKFLTLAQTQMQTMGQELKVLKENLDKA